MDANVAVVIIYIAMAVASWIPYIGWFAWIVPLVFFFMEKQSGFVKFHAVQATGIGILRAVLAIALQIGIWILTPKTVVGALNFAMGRGWGAWALLGTISTIIAIAISLLILYIVITAWGYKQVELPVIGPLAAKAAAKLDDFAKQQGFGQQQPPQQPPVQ
jgi:uncharacterized membrane protein